MAEQTGRGAPQTFYWYDYETFGVDPRRDRPAQFAGRRTNLDLTPAGEGEVFYCRPPMDQLPSPESALLTVITPQLCAEKGLNEAEFSQRVFERLNTPGTISIGYNTLGFDDEVNRFLFWRNFLDPYTHSWQQGCSRWDLFPLVCAAWALRGDGIVWPQWQDLVDVYPKARGRSGVCFKLEFLTKANGVGHDHAHDALSDVHATIGLARLLMEKEPRLWQWALENRTTQKVHEALADRKPVVWVTPRFGVARGCTGIVACLHQEKHDCWMWDLTADPTLLRTLSFEELRRRIKLPHTDPEALPIRKLKANASPFVCANLRVLSPERAARYGIDLAVAAENIRKFQEIASLVEPALADVLSDRFADEDAAPVTNPDASLYQGFPSRNDKLAFARIRASSPEQLKAAAASGEIHFDDPQFAELLLRYRARNWPETLSEEEAQHWRAFCRSRLIEGADRAITLQKYFDEIDALQASPRYEDEAHQEILGALYDWGEYLGSAAE